MYNTETQCPLLKAIWLNNKYDNAIWFVEIRKELGRDNEFWEEVYLELIRINGL
jgi:hypothetical protein